MDIQKLTDRIENGLARKGLSPRAASLKATSGGSADVVRNIKRGHLPSSEKLVALAKLLGFEWRDLFEDGSKEKFQNAHNIQTFSDHGSDGAPVDGGAIDWTRIITEGLVGNRDLPVFGSAEGGANGIYVIDPEPVLFVKRPSPLFDVPTGFGILVKGDSMAPEFDPGDIVLVHPTKPLERGKSVILASAPDLNGAQRYLIKRLVSWDARAWRIAQHNPPRQWDVSRHDWPTAWRSVGKYSA